MIMNPEEKLINRVADSGLITIDLEEVFPKNEKESFDLKDYLFHGLILKEKDFREALKNLDWEKFRGKSVAVFCSAYAIIPLWAYMLAGVYLEPVASGFFFCREEDLDEHIMNEAISRLDISVYQDQRVIIKGCSDKSIPDSAYLEITRRLRPVVKSLMYGEACSNVPLYKKKS